MSLARAIKRKAHKYNWPSKPQYTEYDEEGNYVTLHPTKGYKRVSARRIRAQEQMFRLMNS